MGNVMSAVWVGVIAKVFRTKKGKILRSYCSKCETENNFSGHCPNCGTKIEKTFQEETLEIEPYILKCLSPKQIKEIQKSEDVREAMFEGKLFGELDFNDQCGDEKGETVLVGKCISNLDSDGMEECTLTFKKFVKVFNQLKRLGLAKKLDNVRYYHTQIYG